MREIGPSGDAKSGATASGGSPSEPPPSSQRAVIGTNIDAAQAYVPPTSPMETPEPPVPDTKVALSAEVDPRKAPTSPNMKKAAQAIASERPPPVAEAPPDSQPSGVRRGSGYAPFRSNFPPPPPPPSRSDISRATPSKGIPKTVAQKAPATRSTNSVRPPSLRTPPPVEATETPAQRGAALLLIFLFAALLAVAVYFFLRRAPAPAGEESAPSSSATTPAISTAHLAPSVPAVAPSPSVSDTTEPTSPASAAPTLSATAMAAPQGTHANASGASSEVSSPGAAPPATSGAPAASSTAAPAASGPDKQKSDRWF